MSRPLGSIETDKPPGKPPFPTGQSLINQVDCLNLSQLSAHRRAKKKEYILQVKATGPEKRTSFRSHAFRKRFFPQATASQWNDWRWQLENCIKNLDELTPILRLSPYERNAQAHPTGSLPMSITPYYASLLDPENPAQALRRSVVPVEQEHSRTNHESADPLNEDKHSPVLGIVHRYPDRVLFLVTPLCATYCRYCTRSRIVGNNGRKICSRDNWEDAIAYIESNRSIRDVLLSGGDPLTLPDESLERLLSRLRSIPHVEILRIGTKVPVVLPQRITTELTRMLKRFHPLWMSIHFTHPEEITTEVCLACTRLADAGIPLGSQTVLLSGVNDDVEIMKGLFQGLLQMRVRPYYLYQCDPVPGSSHFRTSVAKGLEIIRGLRGYTSGYAVPTYVIDAPGGGGKIPLLPDTVVGRDGDHLVLKNYEGKSFSYPDVGY